MEKGKLWLIKYESGHIQGPLTAEKIYNLIDNKQIVGTELISVYPTNKWQSISLESEFYDYLLQCLQSDALKTNVSAKNSQSNVHEEVSSATVIADVFTLKALKLKKKNKKNNFSKEKKKKKSIQPKTVIYTVNDELEDEGHTNSNLSVKNSNENKSFFKKNRIKILLLIAIITVCFLFFPDDVEKESISTQYVELRAPKWNQSNLSKDQVDLLIKKGLFQFLRSNVPSYLKSQMSFVQAIERDSKRLLPVSFLCFVYMELWPFSKQDFTSMRTISALVRKSGVLNKGGIYSGLCYSVDLLIKKEYETAKTMIESSLNGLANTDPEDDTQKLLPFFYYLKAVTMYYLNDIASMMSYLSIVQKMLPGWIKPYLLRGEGLLKQNKISEALSTYKKVLKLQPQNKEAQIHYGILEFRYFNQLEKGEQRLIIATNNPDLVSYKLMSDAYFSLAEIKVKKNDPEKALIYAKKAYSYNPANKASRNLIVQIGGINTLKNTQVRSSQLIYKGDELTLENRFQEAIGYYETAFKIDNNKNAMVAVKIAKNFWQLSFFDEAIRWLKKAMEADPNMIEAYVLMSNYYAHNYDFYNASKILQTASQKFTRSYEVYRGMAYLSLKKAEYENAIRYATTALKIYEADMESYIILSESYARMGNVNESFASANRALEVDPNSIKAQVAYAKAIGWVYGIDIGSDYFKKLVTNYSTVMEYRTEWAKYLFEDEQYDRALVILQEIVDLNPKHYEAYFYIGRILMFNENYQGAYESFLKSAIINPSNPTSTFYIGLLRMEEKNYVLAKEQFKKVLALNKLYPEAHFYLGRIAFLQGGKSNYYEAIKEARLEIKSNPNLITPFILAGESYEKLGLFLKCAGEYQKAIELDPDNMDYYVKTARCYRKSGYLDLAVNILKKVLGTKEQKTGEPQLYRELGLILEMRANHDYAVGAYCNYLNLFPRAPDRVDIERRVRKISSQTGKGEKNCEYLRINEELLSLF